MENNYRFINMELLDAMASNDSDFAAELLTDYLERTPVLLDKINDAGQTKDLKTIHFIAHKLRATFDFLGVTELSDIVFRIEKESMLGHFCDEIQGQIREVNEKYGSVRMELTAALASYQC